MFDKIKAFFLRNWKPTASGLVIGIPIGGWLATGTWGQVFLSIWSLGAALIKLAAALL